MSRNNSRRLFGLKRREAVKPWLRNESGAATIEAVLWLPVVLFVLGLVVDFSMVFHGQSQALRIIQDANRNVSIGRLHSTAEAETYVEDRLAGLSPSADAVSVISSGVVTTTVTLPASELQFVGFFRGLNTVSLSVSAQHLIENWES